jgi:hypothetical protein
MEQRVKIEFCFKAGKTATETFQLSFVHGFLNVRQDFGGGSENLEDDERSGRQTTVRTPDMI